jgi:hypothetical protein
MIPNPGFRTGLKWMSFGQTHGKEKVKKRTQHFFAFVEIGSSPHLPSFSFVFVFSLCGRKQVWLGFFYYL